MANIIVTLKDGSTREYDSGVTLLEVAKSLSQKLGKVALLAVVDGKNKDLTDVLENDASVEFITADTTEGLHAIRHTAAHVMAQAIQHLFPGTKFAIGPAIANGFYYDLDSEHVFTPEDLVAIEKEMAKIVKANSPLVRTELPRAEALAMFTKMEEPYKVELIINREISLIFVLDRTARQQDVLKRLNYKVLPALIGVVTKRIRCCSVFMELPLILRKNLMLTLICWKKQLNAIIVNLAKNSIFSASKRRGHDFHSSIQMV